MENANVNVFAKIWAFFSKNKLINESSFYLWRPQDARPRNTSARRGLDDGRRSTEGPEGEPAVDEVGVPLDHFWDRLHQLGRRPLVVNMRLDLDFAVGKEVHSAIK